MWLLVYRKALTFDYRKGLLCAWLTCISQVRFCEDIVITADKASKLYIYYGLSSAAARILAGRICDVRQLNTFYVYQGLEFVVGLSTILVTLADDYSDMIIFVVFYGFCDGFFITT